MVLLCKMVMKINSLTVTARILFCFTTWANARLPYHQITLLIVPGIDGLHHVTFVINNSQEKVEKFPCEKVKDTR